MNETKNLNYGLSSEQNLLLTKLILFISSGISTVW